MRIKQKSVLEKNASGVETLLGYVVFVLLFIGTIVYSFYFFKDELICTQTTGICKYVSSTITKKITDETIFSLKNVDKVAIIRHKLSTGKKKYTKKPTISIRYGKNYTNNNITISYNTYLKFKNYYKNPTTDFKSASYNLTGIIILLITIPLLIIIPIINKRNKEEMIEKALKKRKNKKGKYEIENEQEII